MSIYAVFFQVLDRKARRNGEANGRFQGDAQPGGGSRGHLRGWPRLQPAGGRADRMHGQEQEGSLLQGGGSGRRDNRAAAAHGAAALRRPFQEGKRSSSSALLPSPVSANNKSHGTN